MEWLSRPTPYSGLGGSGIPDFATIDDVPAPSGAAVSLGVGRKGPYSVDLDSESPHILVNAPTGLGKSAVARAVAVQRLALGDIVVLLDRKMHSHPWARELAPVTWYADSTPAIGATLINLGLELQRRNEVLRADPDAEVGSRVVVVFEETNATLTRLRAMDKASGQEAEGALDAFADLMFMGRAVKMHVVAFAQLASYRSGLTADLIENFGTKVLVGYSEKAWKWLAADCGRFRVAPAQTGRGMVCRQGRASEVQLTWMPEESAAEYVLNSVPAQRLARRMSGDRRNLPAAWREAIAR